MQKVCPSIATAVGGNFNTLCVMRRSGNAGQGGLGYSKPQLQRFAEQLSDQLSVVARRMLQKPEADSEKLQTKSLRRLESYDRLKPFAEAPQVLALFSLGFAALTRCSLKRLAVAVRKS